MTDHCFVSCLKYYSVEERIIEFASDIIKDLLSLIFLKKIYNALGIISSVSYIDKTDKNHSPKQNEIPRKIVQPKIDLILMY
jgi:hypothetical protein